MMADSFPVLLQGFFGHLRTAQEVSLNTIAAYRDAFRLLLNFMAKQKGIAIDRLTLKAISPDMVLAFLDHLQKHRSNSARTRNARLAAVRAFARFVLSHGSPDCLGQMQRILAIPCKRADKPLLGFLNREEIKALLAAPNLTTQTGRRDHLLFSLLYNTGARISEVLRLTPDDVQGRVVRLHGKGRKEREVPLWAQTHRELKRWCQENAVETSKPIFSNRHGQALSRRGVARRLGLTLQRAAKACPSLRGRKVTLHSWRHSTAMHLLQARVPVEVIALWLGHEQLSTTHGYLEADLTMKKEILDHLRAPAPWRRKSKVSSSHVLAFLEAL